MAFRAGAQVANMEFIQFHPTALYPTEDPAFLISEALRGEGATLRRLDGHSFMEDYHPLGSLAPRDIVARAIDREMRESGHSHVLLDVSPIPRQTLETRFPGALRGCLARGVDLYGTGIPVVPAAHYLCGGVMTDVEGRTTLPRLYAAGEVACTGVHGANRLASNSLLEAVVFSHRAARSLIERLADEDGARWSARPRRQMPGAAPGEQSPPASALTVTSARESGRAHRLRAELRSLMWEHVGIVRSDQLLEQAQHDIVARKTEWASACAGTPCSPEGVELRNLLQVADLIVRCARLRSESRGLHYNVDHPWRNSERYLRDTVLRD
jgi:L-aspartate oxidase